MDPIRAPVRDRVLPSEREQEGGVGGGAKGNCPMEVFALLGQLLLEDVGNDVAGQECQHGCQRRLGDLAGEPDGPPEQQGADQHPAPDPRIVLLVVLAQPVVVDHEVLAHGDGEEDQGPAARVLNPLAQDVPDQGVVGRE